MFPSPSLNLDPGAVYYKASPRDLIMPFQAIEVVGRNTDVDSAAAEDIWTKGGVYVAPTAARVHAIVSNSANDTAAGTGARTVKIQGIDSNFNLVTENVTLNGTTPVNTSGSYWTIDILGRTYGSGATNAGLITATAATDATVTNQVEGGYLNSASSVFMVPTGYKGYITRWWVALYDATDGAAADVRLRQLVYGDTSYANLSTGIVSKGGVPFFEQRFPTPLVIAAKTTVKVTAAEMSINNCDIASGYDITLIAQS